jgi:hypothetical protein
MKTFTELLKEATPGESLLSILPEEYVHKYSKQPIEWSPDGSLVQIKQVLALLDGNSDTPRTNKIAREIGRAWAKAKGAIEFVECCQPAVDGIEKLERELAEANAAKAELVEGITNALQYWQISTQTEYGAQVAKRINALLAKHSTKESVEYVIGPKDPQTGNYAQ